MFVITAGQMSPSRADLPRSDLFGSGPCPQVLACTLFDQRFCIRGIFHACWPSRAAHWQSKTITTLCECESAC
jgi:hypothetical protein